MSNGKAPLVKCFFHKDTSTCTYVVQESTSKAAAIIDSVLDYEPAAAHTSQAHNDLIIAYCQEQQLDVQYIMETHVHADHLTGANYLHSKFPKAKTCIGENVVKVQTLFQKVFNLVDAKDNFQPDGSQFDILLKDGQELVLGEGTPIKVYHTPGHTPACVSLLIGKDALFTGDTLFMPDMGTARCDFPGGSVEDLYNSIQKIYKQVPEDAGTDNVRVFVGHDYGPGGREIKWETTLAEEMKSNKQLTVETSLETFTKFRSERDAGLGAPKLIIPALQVNLRNGDLPPPESNGTSYLKVPLNVVGK